MDELVSVFDEDRYCSTDEERLCIAMDKPHQLGVYKILCLKIR